MSDFVDWRAFDYDAAQVQLWIFKKSITAEKFRAWHVKTDDDLENLFRASVKASVEKTSEHIGYTPISQNNESSCLVHALEDSDGVVSLLNLVDAPENENVLARLKDLRGAAGYLVKFQVEDEVVYAVRRTPPTWKPKIRSSMINAVFHDGELSAVPDETFAFDAFFDFYCINETVLVMSKRAYESAMAEKKAYSRNFDDLVVDPVFTSMFVDVEPLKAYVGSNAMHLRRIAVIQQKALYLRPGFSQKVKQVSVARNFGLNFDQNDKIVACGATAKTILQILLDHRLLSEITDTIYDVPDAAAL
ncbi:MAG: Kiwa anti-phage protein KwaB-like domain-containing protein [Pseudomonadota bacterium]